MFVKTTKELSAYCGRTFKYGGDMRLSIETLETPTFYLPDDPLSTATAGQMKLWGDAVTLVGKQWQATKKTSRSCMPSCGGNALPSCSRSWSRVSAEMRSGEAATVWIF